MRRDLSMFKKLAVRLRQLVGGPRYTFLLLVTGNQEFVAVLRSVGHRVFSYFPYHLMSSEDESKLRKMIKGRNFDLVVINPAGTDNHNLEAVRFAVGLEAGPVHVITYLEFCDTGSLLEAGANSLSNIKSPPWLKLIEAEEVIEKAQAKS